MLGMRMVTPWSTCILEFQKKRSRYENTSRTGSKCQDSVNATLLLLLGVWDQTARIENKIFNQMSYGHLIYGVTVGCGCETSASMHSVFSRNGLAGAGYDNRVMVTRGPLHPHCEQPQAERTNRDPEMNELFLYSACRAPPERLWSLPRSSWGWVI